MTGHIISTRKETKETVYNYKGVNILVVDRITVNNEDNSVLDTKTHYECNCSTFHKLEDAENFVEEVFFSGPDAIIPTNKVEQNESVTVETVYTLEEKKEAIEKQAQTDGMDVSFINKNDTDLVVYRRKGAYNVDYVIPLEEDFQDIQKVY